MEISAPVLWSLIKKSLQDYINRLSILSDFSPIESCDIVNLLTSTFSAKYIYADIELTHPINAHYSFYTNGSLIHLSTPEVFISWSWVQIYCMCPTLTMHMSLSNIGPSPHMLKLLLFTQPFYLFLIVQGCRYLQILKLLYPVFSYVAPVLSQICVFIIKLRILNFDFRSNSSLYSSILWSHPLKSKLILAITEMTSLIRLSTQFILRILR